MKRIALLMLLAFVLVGCGQASSEATEETAPVMQTETVTEPEETTQTAPQETIPERKTYTLTFAGDCTFGASPAVYYAQLGFIKTVGDDFQYPFRNVKTYFEEDDFSMVNLEGPLGETGSPVPKRHNFRGPAKYVQVLTENSVEAVTLANNHTLDYGPSCYESTLQTLQSAGVPFVEKDSSVTVTLEDGLVIGIYATSYEQLDKADLVEEISALKQQGADLVIYAAHWGVEGSYRASADQTELGYLAIDAGADIVFGSHPHVLQPIEEYHGGVIYYSLGNFSFGGNCDPQDYDTAIIRQEVTLEPDGQLVLGERNVIPCSVSSVEHTNNFQPTPYEPGSEAYNRVLEKLSGTFDGPNLRVG